MQMAIASFPMDGMKDRLCMLLQQRADNDELFARSFYKPNKSMDECMRFVTKSVLDDMSEQVKTVTKKRRNCGIGGGYSDEWVLSKAIHYFDEDDITVDDEFGFEMPEPELPKSSATQTTPQARIIPMPKPKPKPKFVEGDLFFGLDDDEDEVAEKSEDKGESIIDTTDKNETEECISEEGE